jgi:DNA-binding response OmpR family regulator
MVIDENAQTIARAAALLESDYEVVICGRRIGRVELIQGQQPALVLLGVRLPFLAGDEVLRAIRATPPLGVPVLIVSGADPAYLDDLVRESGADGWLRKNDLDTKLAPRVAALIETRSGSTTAAPAEPRSPLRDPSSVAAEAKPAV